MRTPADVATSSNRKVVGRLASAVDRVWPPHTNRAAGKRAVALMTALVDVVWLILFVFVYWI